MSRSVGAAESEGSVLNLNEAYLDWDALDCVLADLDDFSAVHQIQARDALGREVAVGDLVEARDQLVARKLSAVQVVYGFADQVWCDTFILKANGAQLSRMLDPNRVEDSSTIPPV